MQVKVSKLSEPMLMKLLQAKIIDSSKWVYEMLKIDYSPEHIGWLHQLYTGTAL